MLFNARELAMLRDMDESAMLDSVQVVSVTQVADGGGSFTESTTTTTTRGRLRVRGGSERYTDHQVERGTHEVVLPRDTAITGLSRVLVGGRAYRVVYCPVLTELDTALRVGLVEAE